MDRLRCCVRLFIVQLLVSTGANADDWLYTIKPGDTLWEVCADYVTGPKPQCIAKLHAYNTRITNKRRLPPGMRIKIPVTLLKHPPQSAVVEFTQGDAFLVRPGLAQKEILKAGQAVVQATKKGFGTLAEQGKAPLFTRHHYFVRAQTIDRHGRLSGPGPVTRWTNKMVELWLALAVVIAALLLVVRFR